MKRLQGLFMASLLTLSPPALANQAVTQALEAFSWEKRQILLFSPDDKHADYQQFLEAVENLREDFDDRRLHVWRILPEQPVSLGEAQRDDVSAQDFQAAYGVSGDEFRVILIGYDQGEKLRQDKVDIDRLFGEIDRMPMRIQEMGLAE